MKKSVDIVPRISTIQVGGPIANGLLVVSCSNLLSPGGVVAEKVSRYRSGGLRRRWYNCGKISMYDTTMLVPAKTSMPRDISLRQFEAFAPWSYSRLKPSLTLLICKPSAPI
jgi:hypothetical protein